MRCTDGRTARVVRKARTRRTRGSRNATTDLVVVNVDINVAIKKEIRILLKISFELRLLLWERGQVRLRRVGGTEVAAAIGVVFTPL